jgi:MHS family proline/betaine transporter-like MFS transporter
MIIVFYVIMGYLSSRFGYARVILGCMLMILLLVVPVFQVLATAADLPTLLAGQLILAFFMSSTGLFVEMLGHAFPTSYRNIGISLTCTVPATIIGGLTPLLCSYGIHYTGLLIFPAYYLLILGLLALPFGIQLVRHTRAH